MPLDLRAGLLIRHTLSEIDGQLRMDAALILPPTRPLFRNIHHRQIQHFQQTVICREDALGFCDFPQLPIKAFDRVRGIDQTADFLIRRFTQLLGWSQLHRDGRALLRAFLHPNGAAVEVGDLPYQ